LLDTFRKGQRWLSLIFVSVIGLVFVFFLGIGGGSGPGTPSGNFIVQLDEVKLTSRDFEREKVNLEARLRQELGDAYDKVVARTYIESQALGNLTNSLVLASAAEELGLHTTQDELRRVVRAARSSSTKRVVSVPRPLSASPPTNMAASGRSSGISPAVFSVRNWFSSSWVKP